MTIIACSILSISLLPTYSTAWHSVKMRIFNLRKAIASWSLCTPKILSVIQDGSPPH